MQLVIRGGTVVDGTGAPGRTADVAIDGGMIVAVGRITERGDTEIDADGCIVTPGFVDIHTHYDGQATWDSDLAPSSHHGVTSLAMGNCGVGFAPARTSAEDHAWLIGLLEGVEDIPGTALAEGLTWDWETFPEYLDALGRRRYRVDVGAHVPHAAVRAYVMGERGADAAAIATADELEAMARIVEESIRAGALGFTTSRTLVHRTKAGANIGTYRAPVDEVVAVADGLRRAGKGVMQLISDAYLLADPEFCAAELALLEEVLRTTGRPLSFTVQQPDSAPDRWRELLGWVGGQRAAGFDVRAQVAPRPIGVILARDGSITPFLRSRVWRSSTPEQLARPEVKEQVLRDFHERPWSMPGFTGWPWERLFPLTDPVDYEPRPEHSLAAVCAREGLDPLSYAYDLLAAGTVLYCPLMNYAHGSLDDVREMLASPNTLFGLSDGGAHCATICDASFPTTTLAHWGRDRARRGLGEGLPVELLVQGLTQRTATQVGWTDRGVLAPGLLGDVNVIDMERLVARAPRIVGDLPAGGRRLLQEAEGYVATVKRGEVTFRNGVATDALPGQLMR